MSDSPRHQLDTRAIHAGEPRPRIEGAVAMPVFQSSTFTTQPGQSYHDLGYIRLSTTPNHAALHAKLASLEGTEAALVTASGMAAITTSLLSVLKSGDHMLAQDCLYGGTHNFLTEDLPSLGIEVDFFDGNQADQWRSKLRPNTRVLYAETLTNPLLGVADLEAMAQFAREHGLVSMIDSTFASPVNCRPAELGYDLVLHSATKYLNGHSDIVAGAVAGPAGLVGRIKKKLDHFGGSLDPHACFLLHRGLKTLTLRVARQNDNAQFLAESLVSHPLVRKVHYPGLKAHADHARAARLLTGFGGVLSFELDSDGHSIDQALNELEIMAFAPSLGGTETLITRPAATSHAGMTKAQRDAAGIKEGLVRVAVGCEAAKDLAADLLGALDRLAEGRRKSA